MLRFLSVRHLAVIDLLEVEFEPGLNVLTGETGAGKSVLVEAIGLLAGGRASADLVRTAEDHANVQAVFETSDQREVIVRREVSAQGRSRAFIDDTLATSAALRDLGAKLVELHGQHEHQALTDPAEHVGLLDAFAAHPDLLAATTTRFDAWRLAADALDRSQLSEREKRARIEMASFQLQEIEKVAPRAGEDDSLETERNLVSSADRLERLAREAYLVLYDDESSALARLAVAWKRLSELAAIDARFQQYVDQRNEIKTRLEDVSYFLRDYVGTLDASPGRLQALEDRLAALDRLRKRYGPALADVLARRDALRAELTELEASEEQIAILTERERVSRNAFREAAADLTKARVKASERLAIVLTRDLADLAMPACRIEIRVAPVEDPNSWTRLGSDACEFFFSPNPGEELRPLARIASGGELSRLMLALRIATLADEGSRTLIFDEVDAGIGGEAADAVGARLQALGRAHQVLCVTHLAQIAARADAHFQINKLVRAGRTHTTLSRLDGAGREAEIGRMIAGTSVSAQVLASAREMLEARRRSEQKANMQKTSRSEAKAKGKQRA